MNPLLLQLLLYAAIGMILGRDCLAQPDVQPPAPSTNSTDASPAELTAETMRSLKGPVDLTGPRRERRRGQGVVNSFGSDVVVREGETARDVVVFGASAVVDGMVNGDLVVIGGDAKLGPRAEIKKNLVIFGGKIDADPAAKIGNNRFVLGGGGLFGAKSWIQWPMQWFNSGLLLGRPLPHQYSWSWMIAGLGVLLYLFVALIFPRQVQASAAMLEDKPGSAMFTGMLALMLFGPLLLLLAVTVVGLVVIPFALVASVAILLIGKAAVYRHVGQQIGFGRVHGPLLALALGAGLFCLLYTVPVLGFLAWGVVTALGIGAAMLALFKRSRPLTGAPDPLNVPGVAAADVPPIVGSPAGVELFNRAGFWLRFLATMLDFALVSMVMTVVVHQARWFLLAWTLYHLLLWSWRGTTIGGIILGLRIVRTDGRPIGFAVALVRGLASFFSAAVFGLGFFWAGWSREKQSWHDKIAGTVVIRCSRNSPPL